MSRRLLYTLLENRHSFMRRYPIPASADLAPTIARQARISEMVTREPRAPIAIGHEEALVYGAVLR